MCTLQRIKKLDFQLYRQSIQPDTQAQPPCPLKMSHWMSHWQYKKKKKIFLLRLRCFMLGLEPIQSFLLLPAGTMGSLSSHSSHILKVIQMENIPSPKRNMSLLIQEYAFLSLSGVKPKIFEFLLSPMACHVTYMATYLFGHKTLTKGQRNTFITVHNPSHLPLTEHK